MASQGGSGSGSDPSWADALDPVANLRALGEIQRRGLEAAGDLVDRMVKAVDGDSDSDADDDGSASRSQVDGLIDLWGDLVRRSLQTMLQPWSRSAASSDPAVSVDDAASPAGAVHLVVGGETDELWLHNPTTRDIEGVVLHCAGLWAHDGTPLGGVVVFDPEVIDVLHARSSRGVQVSAKVNGSAPAPGTYRGVVLMSGLPDAWVPIDVTVES